MQLLDTLTADTATSFGVLITAGGVPYSFHVSSEKDVRELVAGSSEITALQVTAQRDNNYRTLSDSEVLALLVFSN